MIIDDSIPRAIVELKKRFVEGKNGRRFLSEVVPLENSSLVPIETTMLESLHRFAKANSIYFKSYESQISSAPCRVYEGDINQYWLSSKKHDTSYQPFYPTWMLSAYALALGAKSLGFEQIVDIGSGDGRIAYCARLLDMESFGIEIDDDLVQLQERISSITGVRYNAIRADATRFDYDSLELSRPMFFISALPEMGKMLACNVIKRITSVHALMHDCGFNFMGSHVMNALSRDHTRWGWGTVIASFGLDLTCEVTLPTHWTTDQRLDTAYVYTRCR